MCCLASMESVFESGSTGFSAVPFSSNSRATLAVSNHLNAV